MLITNRRGFLRFLGLAGAGVVVAPKLALEDWLSRVPAIIGPEVELSAPAVPLSLGWQTSAVAAYLSQQFGPLPDWAKDDEHRIGQRVRDVTLRHQISCDIDGLDSLDRAKISPAEFSDVYLKPIADKMVEHLDGYKPQVSGKLLFPHGMDEAVMICQNGLTVRGIRQYITEYDQVLTRFDILVG